MIPLLQQREMPVTGFGEFDPRITAILIGAVALVIIAGVVNSVLTGGGSSRSRTQRFSKRGFIRSAKRAGLSRAQAITLLTVARNQGIASPMRLLQDGPLLDKAIRDGLYDIDESVRDEPERERRKSELFQIRNLIAVYSQSTRSVRSSKTLRIGQDLDFSTDGRTWHTTRVSSQTGERFGVETPCDDANREVRPGKGAKVRLRFRTESGNLYSVTTTVLGYGIARRMPTLFLAHSDQISRVQHRKYPRREFHHPCYYYPVSVVTSGRGRRAKRQAVVNHNDRRFGRFEDLSAGGAAVRTQRPLPAKSLLKIEFETADGVPVSVFGKIRSVEKATYRSGLMHIMFAGASRKHLNAIQSYVYGYVDE